MRGRNPPGNESPAKAEMEFSGAADPQKASRKDRAYGRQPSGIRKQNWAHEWALWSGIVKERPMIFNAEMVRAILDGRKTQTRRIMKVQPENAELGLRRITDSSVAKEVGMYFWCLADACGVKHRSNLFSCPFGEVGDRIWVREAFRVHSRASDVATLVYKASEQQSWTQQTHRVPIEQCTKPAVVDKWTPSLHMPRWASRITLEVTGVRVERLNDISDADALNEGCSTNDMKSGDRLADVFSRLWSSIYGAENWKANPWVWVITFKRIEGGAA